MTWTEILAALGLVAILEGLVLALAPSRLEELLIALRAMPDATKRMIGLGIITLGVLLLSLSRL